MNNNIIGNSNSSSDRQPSTRRSARFIAPALALLLPATGLIGCATKPCPVKGPHTRTNPNGSLWVPGHLTSTTFAAGVPKTIYINTAWTTAYGYNLGEETVSCALKKSGTSDPQHCQTKTVGNQYDNSEQIPFTFTVAATGIYSIYTYNTGKLQDTSVLDAVSDGISAHCPSARGQAHHKKHTARK